MMGNRGRFIFGLLVIIIGLVLLLEQANIFPPISNYFWELFSIFWPLILIYFGSKLLREKKYTSGIVLLLLGLVFLSTNLFGWNFFGVLWPVTLITIGISLLFKNELPKNERGGLSQEELTDTVIFWSSEKKITSNSFKKGDFNVAFGVLELDLSEAKVDKKGAELVINCAFGKIDIYVPKGCKIKCNESKVLGAWKCEVEKREGVAPVLEISGISILAKVEIKEH